MERQQYASKDEVRQHWNTKLDNFKFNLSPNLNNRYLRFRKQFDPCKRYSEKWWEKMLGCHLGDISRVGKTVVLSEQVYETFASVLSYPVPSSEAISAIREFVGSQKIHEHLAGSGYWAYLLEEEGCRVDAFDKHCGVYQVAHEKTFTYVAIEDARKAELPSDVALMLSWVPRNSNVAQPLLRQMQSGQKFVFLTEPSQCEAKATKQYIETHFTLVRRVNLPQMMYGVGGVEFYTRN